MPLPDNTIKVTFDLGSLLQFDPGTPPSLSPPLPTISGDWPAQINNGSPPSVSWERRPLTDGPFDAGKLRFDGGTAPSVTWGPAPTITLPTINPGTPPSLSGGSLPAATIEIGRPVITAIVEGGSSPISAQVGNIPSEAFAATISGPHGKPIGASVEASASITANVGGTGSPILLAPLKLEIGSLRLRPNVTVKFRLFGIPIWSISIEGQTDFGP